MRFLSRGLAGLVLTALTLALLALAAGEIARAIADREAARQASPPGRERVYVVRVAPIELGTAQPLLTAYGDVESARSLELRAAVGGTLLELAPEFRDGGRVAAGEVLYRIDPAEAAAARALAENAFAAAQAEEAEARAALALAREEIVAAERQRDLRAAALARSTDLRGRGVGTASDLETAELALSSAEQALSGRRLALAQAEARIGRAAISVDRARIEADEAARRLADTMARAPFAGVLGEVEAVVGRRVSAGEALGALVDPAALEVAFRVGSAEFARLADDAGGVLPLAMTAGLEIDGLDLWAPGRVERVAPAAGAGQSGRLVHATLSPETPGLLRPGDFVTVRIEEPALEGVATLPASAVDPAGRILVLGADDRLEEVAVRVLRRQGETVIVDGAPEGREVVLTRAPQLAPGVAARPERGDGPETGAAGASALEAMVRLSPERRAGLIAEVEANGRMPAEAKARILAALRADEVPQQMIDRLEARSGG